MVQSSKGHLIFCLFCLFLLTYRSCTMSHMSQQYVDIESYEDLIKYNPVFIQVVFGEDGLYELRIRDENNVEIEFRTRTDESSEIMFNNSLYNSNNPDNPNNLDYLSMFKNINPNFDENIFCEFVHRFTNLVELWIDFTYTETDISINGLPESLKVLTISNESFYKPFMDNYIVRCSNCAHSSTMTRPLYREEINMVINTDTNTFHKKGPHEVNNCIECKYHIRKWCPSSRYQAYDHKFINMLNGYLSTVVPAKDTTDHRQLKSATACNNNGDIIYTEIFENNTVNTNIPTMEQLDNYVHVCSSLCDLNYTIKNVFYN